MHKIGDDTPTADLNGEFQETPTATDLRAPWMNTLQRELLAILAEAGIAPNAGDDAQLIAALNALFLRIDIDGQLVGQLTHTRGNDEFFVIWENPTSGAAIGLTSDTNGRFTFRPRLAGVWQPGQEFWFDTVAMRWGFDAVPYVDTAPLAVVPTGVTLEFAGSVAPTGYLLCDGSAVSRTTYAALFAVIGTTYGVGDGSTTFNVPDERGRTTVGLDNMGGVAANRMVTNPASVLGQTGGAEVHTLTDPEMPIHTHDYGYGETSFTGGGGAALTRDRDLGSSNAGPTSTAGGDQPHNNTQPYIAKNKIIKT